jgi:probable HAF family extracellular repeat protein
LGNSLKSAASLRRAFPQPRPYAGRPITQGGVALSTSSRITLHILAVFVAALGTTGSRAEADATYSLADLGTGVLPTGISPSGQLFGTAAGQAYLYSNGQMIPIAGLPRGSDVVAVNDAGQTAGNLPNGHAFLDTTGAVTDLGALGGLASNAAGMNASGEVVGNSQTTGGGYVAFLYNGTMQSLGTLGGASSFASGINNTGQIVGGSTTSSGVQHAFLDSGGTMHDLGTLGGTISAAAAINGSAQVAGSSQLGNGLTHAFLYTDGSLHDLGSLGNSSFGFGLNASGSVVGSAYIVNPDGSTSNRAFVSQNGGSVVDLNSLVSAQGWTLTTATGISDTGVIVGYGNVNGQPHGFLLTPLAQPVPEPTTLALLAIASLGWLSRHQLRRKRA